MSKIYNRAIFIEKAPPCSGPSLVTNISTSEANSIIGDFGKRVILLYALRFFWQS